MSVTAAERWETGGGNDRLTLRHQSAENGDALITSNFRRGDAVYLYEYADSPDARRSILFRAVIDKLLPDSIELRLNNGQRDATLFSGNRHWAVEHSHSDISTSNNLRSLFEFAQAKKNKRDILLGITAPRADSSLTLTRSYHHAYDDIVLRSKQARDFFLLVGPPGTGKTSMAMRFITQEALASAQAPVLLTAYTNRAVDEICQMLCDAGIDFLRLGSESSCDERFRDHLADNVARRLTKLEDLKLYINKVEVVVATTTMLESRPYIFRVKHFRLAVVDEASQILEPNIIGILTKTDRFVLIGDYRQLPAVVQQEEPVQTLFERLIRQEQQARRTLFTGTLCYQGRMHPEVALFPATMFYHDQQLLPVPLPHQQEPTLGYDTIGGDDTDRMIASHRMLFLHVTPDRQDSPLPNWAEARLVADLLRRLQRLMGSRFQTDTSVGVIVPYRSQIAAIRHEIDRLAITDMQDVCIDTVERYQGSSRDVIIYSFTATTPAQMDFIASSCFNDGAITIDRRLNVALTRARRQVIMTGDSRLLCRNAIFRQLIEQYSPSKPNS